MLLLTRFYNCIFFVIDTAVQYYNQRRMSALRWCKLVCESEFGLKNEKERKKERKTPGMTGRGIFDTLLPRKAWTILHVFAEN
jgi:hypothetical protein